MKFDDDLIIGQEKATVVMIGRRDRLSRILSYPHEDYGGYSHFDPAHRG